MRELLRVMMRETTDPRVDKEALSRALADLLTEVPPEERLAAVSQLIQAARDLVAMRVGLSAQLRHARHLAWQAVLGPSASEDRIRRALWQDAMRDLAGELPEGSWHALQFDWDQAAAYPDDEVLRLHMRVARLDGA